MTQEKLKKINELSKKIEYVEKHINLIETRKKNCAMEDLEIRLGVARGVDTISLIDDCFYKEEFIEVYLIKANNLLAKLKKEFEEA